MAIVTFKDNRLADILSQKTPKGFPADLVSITRRKLIMLDNAKILADLLIPPANRLESLKGDRKGQYSIRINSQYRLCFIWDENGISEVKCVDYH